MKLLLVIHDILKTNLYTRSVIIFKVYMITYYKITAFLPNKYDLLLPGRNLDNSNAFTLKKLQILRGH